MKISLGSWAFSFGPFADDPVPFGKVLRRLSGAGYDGVEICGFPPHVTLEAYATADSRRELTGILRDHNLGVSGYAADFSSVNPTAEGNRQRYLDLFARQLDLCVALGSPMLRVDTGAAPGSLEDREYGAAAARLAEIWHAAATLALAAGVRVAWEFEPGFVFNKPSEVLALHKRVDHANFRVLFDTSHAYMCSVVGARQHEPLEKLPGGVKQFFRLLEGSIGAIHLIDSDGTLHGEETSTHRPFGEGLIDFPKLAPLLLHLPGIEWWCIDPCFWAGSWDLVESSREYVARLLEGARA